MIGIVKPHVRPALPETAYTCALGSARDVESCGAKAYNLGRMIRRGMSVPRGFVIADQAFQEFLECNALLSPIDSILDGVDLSKPELLRPAAAAIRERIVSAPIPQTILDSIDATVAESLRDLPLIVRSSAVGEDSPKAAFAGQLDSFLNVTAGVSLHDSVRACWASYYCERSMFYQLSRGVRLTGMGVIVQHLIRSRISGVLFTQSPLAAGAGDETMMAEYCYGYGDALVSGHINPGRLAMSRNDPDWRVLSVPESNAADDEAEPIDDDFVAELTEAGSSLEDEFGCPQDVEWTVDDAGQLYLVQSRPITVWPAASGVDSRGIDSSGSDKPSRPERSVLWSNANVNENFPEPISPLLYSIASAGYYHYFRNLGLALGISRDRVRAMEYPLRNIIGVHGARMYYNLTNIHAVFRAAPFGDSLAAWFDTFVGAPPTPLSEEPIAWGSFRRNRLVQTAELIVIALKSAWQFRFLSRRVEDFERIVSEFSRETAPNLLEEKTLGVLLADFRSFMEIRCHRWTKASLADAASMISYGMLKGFLHREFPEGESAGLHNTLLKGLGDVVSGKPIDKLWALSRRIREDDALRALFRSHNDADVLASFREERFSTFRTEFEAYLEEWGFRCSGELMLTASSYQENPEALIAILKAYVKLADESPADRLKAQELERVRLTKTVLARLKKRKSFGALPWPGKSSVLKLILRWTRTSITCRERARLKQALLYSRFRRIALAIGDKLVASGFLEDKDDIFMMTYQEIESLAGGSAMFPYQVKELVELRKKGHARLSEMTPPDVIRMNEGAYVDLEGSESTARGEEDIAPALGRFDGIGACGGRVRARAAVLNDASEFDKLTEGDILVARQTDPGWAPMFFLVKGLVMERGGMLSHGAILAREYGIPTVVGVANATAQIRTGQTLTVDGDRGVVQIVDR